MTLTIETTPHTVTRLTEEAQRRGIAVEELAAVVLDEWLQDLELDAEDAEEAPQILAASDPSQRPTLDDLRRALSKEAANR